MAKACLIDNDVLLKVCAYDLVDEFLDLFGSSQLLVLPAAPYVVEGIIKRTGRIIDKARALAGLRRLVGAASIVEPDADEIQAAAELEEQAHQGGWELDGGESILFSLLSDGKAELLVTGDKRAITALENIAPSLPKQATVSEKVVGFEQLIVAMVGKSSCEAVAPKIRQEPKVDKAIAICFRCSSGNFDPSSAMEGLASYVADLRRAAPKLLIPDQVLTELLSDKDRVG